MLLRVVAKAGHHDTRATNFATVRTGECVGGRLFGGSGSSAGRIGHLVLDPEGERCGCGNVGCVETIVAEHRSVERLVGVAPSLSEALDEGPARLFAVTAEQARSSTRCSERDERPTLGLHASKRARPQEGAISKNPHLGPTRKE